MSIYKDIEIDYTWSKDVFLDASKATYEFELKHSPKRFLGWFFIALVQFGVVGALKKDAYGLLLIATVLVIYWYAFRWPIRRFMISKTYDASCIKNHHFKMFANTDGISVDGTLIAWSMITEIISLENSFLLYYESSFLFIPKSAFTSSDEKDRFTHLAKKSVESYKKDT
jgi:hypothetical protein